MVEGGGTVHTQLLLQGLADELQLVLAPLFVGDPGAPRLFGPGGYQRGRLRLVETRRIEDVVLMRYRPTAPGTGPVASAADRHWLALACELAELCPPSTTAFSVGAVVVAADGTELARGHSREGADPVVHAEEAALAKIDPADPRLANATVYSSLEPCARRASRPAPCARLILDAGVRRVVTAWREPDTFVAGADGSGVLAAGGTDVVVLEEYADRAQAPTATSSADPSGPRLRTPSPRPTRAGPKSPNAVSSADPSGPGLRWPPPRPPERAGAPPAGPVPPRAGGRSDQPDLRPAPGPGTLPVTVPEPTRRWL